MKTDLFEKIPGTVVLKTAPILEKDQVIFGCKSSLEMGGSLLVMHVFLLLQREIKCN